MAYVSIFGGFFKQKEQKNSKLSLSKVLILKAATKAVVFLRLRSILTTVKVLEFSEWEKLGSELKISSFWKTILFLTKKEKGFVAKTNSKLWMKTSFWRPNKEVDKQHHFATKVIFHARKARSFTLTSPILSLPNKRIGSKT